jgi:PIN domain nuclease of toxin-antitoxin system
MDRYLLDTHVILWLATDPSKLSKKVSEILTSNAPKSISIASAWEVAIKLNIKKLVLEDGVDGFYNVVNSNNFNIIEVKKPYLKLIENFGFIHADPFDRLIIATAKVQEMVLITIDKNIQKSDVAWIW